MKPVDLNDPSARRAWIEALRGKVLDLVGVAEDAAKPKGKRFFARAEQRRRTAELEGALLALLDEAAGSLRPLAVVPPAARPSSGPSDDEGPPSTLRPT